MPNRPRKAGILVVGGCSTSRCAGSLSEVSKLELMCTREVQGRYSTKSDREIMLMSQSSPGTIRGTMIAATTPVRVSWQGGFLDDLLVYDLLVLVDLGFWFSYSAAHRVLELTWRSKENWQLLAAAPRAKFAIARHNVTGVGSSTSNRRCARVHA